MTPRYTEAQLSADEPLYQEDVTGTHTLVIRVTADAMEGDVQYSVMDHGIGALDEHQVSVVADAIRRCVNAGAMYRLWYCQQNRGAA